MKIIIFAGGTGKRFWPVSRKSSPKQFQPIVGNEPLIKLKYNYLRQGFAPEDIFLSTGAQYEREVREILPELPADNFIFEPAMRDTGPAVAYAVAYVSQKHPDEIISTQWSDHYIRQPDTFVKALQEAETIALKEGKAVVVGTPARFASPHRGYIKFGRKIRSLDHGEHLVLCEFVRFVEKPTVEVAREYLRSGDYAWNLGYFVDHPQRIMEKYARFAPTIYKTIRSLADSKFQPEKVAAFSNLDKISFDYVYAENLAGSEALVINAEMGWSDVGEWIALKEALEESPEDNVTQGNHFDFGSKDTLIYNLEEKKLVATINLNGMVVVNTPDVVAIFHKDDNGELKRVLKLLEEKGFTKYL